MSLFWYVLHSKPNQEELLCSQLEHRNIVVYYPQLRVQPVNPRARKSKPFFPGYLFVHVDLEKIPLSNLMYIPGARGVVSFDRQPASVSDDVIDVIKKNVLQMNRDVKEPQKGIKQGDKVLIKGGPFEGYQAIFDSELDGSDRVRLLIQLLHQEHVRIQVPVSMVRPVKS
jgi:transcriptional antiterminator RfaH